jgi:hypothetical protein
LNQDFKDEEDREAIGKDLVGLRLVLAKSEKCTSEQIREEHACDEAHDSHSRAQPEGRDIVVVNERHNLVHGAELNDYGRWK